MPASWNITYKTIIKYGAIAVTAAGTLYVIWRWLHKDEYFKRTSKILPPVKSKLALVIGLDGCGKTSFLKSFGESNPIGDVQPTSALCVVSKNIGNVEYTLYEVGTSEGLVRAISYWTEFLTTLRIKSVVFIVDSADRQRLHQARMALSQFSSENDTKNLHLIIVANKQDLPGALLPNQVLREVKDNRYEFKSVDVIGSTVGTGKVRRGVYDIYRALSRN